MPRHEQVLKYPPRDFTHMSNFVNHWGMFY